MINFDKTYDSHVHFFGVGLKAVDWVLEDKSLILPNHLKDLDIVRGFGLDLNVTENQLETLYQNYPRMKFCLSYNDGHSSLVSKSLIDELSFKISNNAKVHKNFISLYENERDRFLRSLPKRSHEELKRMALYSIEYFSARGVKRVRHMTCTTAQWRALSEIFNSPDSPALEIECLFAEFMDQNFDEAIQAFKFAKENQIQKITPGGIKLFVDGSIGQNTAYMSNSKDSKPRLNESELTKRMETVLLNMNTPLALHTIGDMALELSLKIYRSLAEKNESIATLHLEHAPIFTNESLEILKEKKLDCTFHFQPSHWIDDSHWYEKEKHLLRPHSIYPFEELKSLGYKFYMGSDAPVEESLTDLTEKGLEKINKTKG